MLWPDDVVLSWVFSPVLRLGNPILDQAFEHLPCSAYMAILILSRGQFRLGFSQGFPLRQGSLQRLVFFFDNGR